MNYMIGNRPCTFSPCPRPRGPHGDSCADHVLSPRNPPRSAIEEPVITRRPDRSVAREEWYDRGSWNRIDGPAVIERRADGSLAAERWYLGGDLHRLDGPAGIEYAEDGSIRIGLWSIFGKGRSGGHPQVVGILSALTPPRLRTEFEQSVYRVFLDEGLEPSEVLRVISAGVRTPAGIREVLSGAPPEWVQAYENGRT